MIYKYEKKVVNSGNVDDFYNKRNFVGYILPDGTIYEVKEHNVDSIVTFFYLSIYNLKNNYDDKEKFLGDTNDPLLKIVANYFKKVSYEEIDALNDFVEKNNLSVSDVLVGFFNCHLVTRLNKKILTSSINHDIFYNYLLNGFEVDDAPRIIYSNNEFKFVDKRYLHNDFTSDEIEAIINDAKAKGDESLFFK